MVWGVLDMPITHYFYLARYKENLFCFVVTKLHHAPDIFLAVRQIIQTYCLNVYTAGACNNHRTQWPKALPVPVYDLHVLMISVIYVLALVGSWFVNKNKSPLYCGGQLYWWKETKYSFCKSPTNFYHIVLFRVHLAMD